MLLEKQRSCLILIDVQEKLIPFIHQQNHCIKRCQWMLRLAEELSIPILVSEQYPQGLGKTVSQLASWAVDGKTIAKTSFSCWREPQFKNALRLEEKNQLVLIGIETHVCVLQTALDMQAEGFDVFVVVDAVSSRHENDHHYALQRLQQSGIQLISAEMVFFEWLEEASHPAFKKLSKTFLQAKGE